MMQEIIIEAFFRNPVDLAGKMRDWPEFVEGQGYSVDLEDKNTGEIVRVRYFDDWVSKHLSIESTAPGMLFDRVVGCVIRTLSTHRDYLKVKRFPSDPDPLFKPIFK